MRQRLCNKFCISEYKISFISIGCALILQIFLYVIPQDFYAFPRAQPICFRRNLSV
jgi:hypothetical protein